jgi:hypothetical protein
MTESQESARETINLPCFLVNLDLFASSANGRAIRSRSSLLSEMRLTSLSDRSSSSMPRNAHVTYQSVADRIRIREKKSCHSSSFGGPAFGESFSGASSLPDLSRDSSCRIASSSSASMSLVVTSVVSMMKPLPGITGPGSVAASASVSTSSADGTLPTGRAGATG